jgi:GR25 family glycosyltransferase involved in LPS biosynthesis
MNFFDIRTIVQQLNNPVITKLAYEYGLSLKDDWDVSHSDDFSIIAYLNKEYDQAFLHANIGMNMCRGNPEKSDSYARIVTNLTNFIIPELLNIERPIPGSSDVSPIPTFNPRGDVIITMTTCKRLDLFKRTMNSLIYCLKDDIAAHVREIFVVDDCSSADDRKVMQTLYPWINYHFKNTPSHAESMNIIRDYVYTPYFFHIEDDWVILSPNNYISQTKELLSAQNRIGQCLLNTSYGEQLETYGILPGESISLFVNKHVYAPNNNTKISNVLYWPHYSLRVGLNRTYAIKQVGKYNVNANHFEREFAERYVALGFETCFLNGLHAYHIGKCTWEQDKPNAYTLNGIDQFGEKNNATIEIVQSTEEKTNANETYTYPLVLILNLARRKDKKEWFLKHNADVLKNIPYAFVEAVDGMKIQPTLPIVKLFSTNDYHYRRGIIGCAQSHMFMWEELLRSGLDKMIVFEDDAKLDSQFDYHIKNILTTLDNDTKDWNICFLGTFLKDKNLKNNNDNNLIELWTPEQCLSLSFGGTFGYIISANGAKRMLDFINQVGMTNAIDWMMFKFPFGVHITTKHLVTSEMGKDSDIQSSFDTLVNQTDIENMLEQFTLFDENNPPTISDYLTQSTRCRIKPPIYMPCAHTHFDDWYITSHSNQSMNLLDNYKNIYFSFDVLPYTMKCYKIATINTTKDKLSENFLKWAEIALYGKLLVDGNVNTDHHKIIYNPKHFHEIDECHLLLFFNIDDYNAYAKRVNIPLHSLRFPDYPIAIDKISMRVFSMKFLF